MDSQISNMEIIEEVGKYEIIWLTLCIFSIDMYFFILNYNNNHTYFYISIIIDFALTNSLDLSSVIKDYQYICSIHSEKYDAERFK